jgi:hypothetical protein
LGWQGTPPGEQGVRVFLFVDVKDDLGVAALLLRPVGDRHPGALQALAEAVQVEVFGALGQVVGA